ncbi:MAG: protein adenylyltransferase SelO [Hyphomicrobiales bacterium]
MPQLPIQFDNSYAKLPDIFYVKQLPQPVAAPHLIKLNEELAALLGVDLDFLSTPDGLAMLSGNQMPQGASPLAMAYAGHQFGHFVPQLGDGRANLLGEVIGCDGIRRDIQLKGAGQTPFSRMGDGRAALGPILREYIVSEAMHTLGVPTTRALAAVTTGEQVARETFLPGAILTRVAQSHIRVGTFQYFAARQDKEALKILADHVIERHYPEAAKAHEPYVDLITAVLTRQASLIAKWMSLGFIHGVMNTDNMSIAGETIDYGPCAFMDVYHPKTVFSSVDQMGRYAFGNQPGIAHWNLVQFAQCLLPLLDEVSDKAIAKAQEAINQFPGKFEAALGDELRKKIGLAKSQDNDLALAQDLLDLMAENEADFTLTFSSLSRYVDSSDGDNPHFKKPAAFEEWVVRWRARLNEENISGPEMVDRLGAANPVIIPRNHLVEEAIRAAEDNQDFTVFEALTEAMSHPFDEKFEDTNYALPPRAEQIVHRTFCGT